MYEDNYNQVSKAMNFVLRPMLAAFVTQNLERHFGKDAWWQRGVLNVLREEQRRFLPRVGEYGTLTDKLDVQVCLLLIELHWNDIFLAKFPRQGFNWIKELQSIRNSWAHEQDAFDDATTVRALDTMALISDVFDEEAATQLRAMWRAKLSGKDALPPAQDEKIFSPPNALKSWRKVIEPHPDVARGSYLQSEFAADLAQVVRNEGRSEYTNPAEFFSRTYLTDGLKKLLVETLRRLTAGNGEPVIQLKTSFGGGKTHSLLALYHLFGGRITPAQSEAVEKILSAADVAALPAVHTAVIVGTWENPLRATLWGQIAAQLAKSAGKPQLYEMMRENDEQGISPGAELLKTLFDEAGACLILIDEIVAYGRKMRAGKIKAGGTFENLMSFIQELTEAAKASRKSAVVVSIPESDVEIGGDLGRRVLNQVEKFFGRVEFVWTPVSVVEGYEIVRRRLFKPCNDESAREQTCAAFFDMYLNNANDFPYESRQSNYKDKMLACYPIHPKLFDYLYDKWTGLENFQKTRGVLRLMANVIHNLWSSNDESALIMPGSIPLAASEVRDELTKYLKGNWDAIVNSEVDGAKSKPQELDDENSRFGRLTAARKTARAIFMGTAPGSRQGDVRGVEENEIRLGTIQLQDINEIATFNDALTKLKANLYYLYSQGSRLWFGVNPTLRKLVDDKRDQYSDDDIEYEIEQRLKGWQGKNLFKAVVLCPKSSADVPNDKQTAQLVILPPKHLYDDKQPINPATDAAKKILDTCGTIPRRNKNLLLFMAAHAENMEVLRQATRDFMAWREVLNEARKLNLDALQLEDAEGNLKTAAETFAMKVSQAYSCLLVPAIVGTSEPNSWFWRVEEILCTKEDNLAAAAEKFRRGEMLLPSLGCEHLRGLLDAYIWRDTDGVELNKLWDYFMTYHYLPRVVDVNVLLETVKRGVEAKTFALAENENLDGLQFGEDFSGKVELSNWLVKAEVAKKTLEIVEPPPEPETIEPPPVDPPPAKPSPEAEPLPTKFFMETEIERARAIRQVNDCFNEIVELLETCPNVKTSVKLVVSVEVPGGVAKDMAGDIAYNCGLLGIKNFRFAP